MRRFVREFVALWLQIAEGIIDTIRGALEIPQPIWNDEAAIAADWQTVGQDLQRAIDEELARTEGSAKPTSHSRP